MLRLGRDPFARMALPQRLALLVALIPVITFLSIQAGGGLGDSGAASIAVLELHAGQKAGDDALSQWRSMGLLSRAREAVWWDFAFAPAYAAGLALLWSSIAAARALRSHARLARAGFAVAWLQLLAGLLDVAENAGLLDVLAGRSRFEWLVRACAWPKFAIVLGAGPAFGVAAAAVVLHARRHRVPSGA